ncbi:hypothetical protein OIU78_012341 [Salix suchowensis]|nr:hypothetical protein OIU78_012341 [Salix suchowensis]
MHTEMRRLLWWCLSLSSAVVTMAHGGGNVTYDSRSLVINGKHEIIFSGSIHYPRSTPKSFEFNPRTGGSAISFLDTMWPYLISKARAGGLDAIDTYVFWNLHEPQQGQYDFSGRKDLVKFIKEVHAQGLYVCLRIGPFIESEWTYGGLPFWLHDVPGIVFRSDNEPFKYHMERYAKMIVKMLKAEKLYASQGGPIILSQIENEYKNVEAAFHEKGPPYVKWAAKMAVGLQTGVPWVMCKQDDAPDPVINACNGLRCGETFSGPNSPRKPAIWTENWTTVYQVYGKETRSRSAEDIAFHTALFIAKGGSFVNYYMYHGGTNFGRTAAEYVPTSYYDQAPIDEYGLLRQPKHGHMKELHASIKLCRKPLLSSKWTNFSLGHLQEAFVFERNSHECAAFLVNHDGRSNATTVHFKGLSYKLPPKSISILPDCKTVAFNTAQVSTQYGTRLGTRRQKFDSIKQWKEYKEYIPSFDKSSFRANMLLEHMNTTKDSSDYLWYTFRFHQNSSNAHSVLTVNSLGHNLHAFVNGEFIGSAHGSHDNKSFTLQRSLPLKRGTNYVSLLSVMTGLPDGGAYLERRVAGLRRVTIQRQHELHDFTTYLWGYKVGLSGENIQLHRNDASVKAYWSRYASSSQPLTWYKTIFDAPVGNDPVALNLASMGKGEAWVNGQSIGRYWVSFLDSDGNPYQTWNHIPRSFLKPSGNLLVLLEEEKGNPLGISIGTMSTTKVCGHVSSSYPPPVISWQGENQINGNRKRNHGRRPRVQLRCPRGRKISSVLFSSFGTPSGDCETYATGSCHASNSRAIVEKACLGKERCSIPVSSKNFHGDPCPGIAKSLLVDAKCS